MFKKRRQGGVTRAEGWTKKQETINQKPETRNFGTLSFQVSQPVTGTQDLNIVLKFFLVQMMHQLNGLSLR